MSSNASSATPNDWMRKMTEGPGRARRSRLRLRASVAVVALGAGAYWGAQWIEHRAGHVFETDARIASDMVSISSRAAGTVPQCRSSTGRRSAACPRVAWGPLGAAHGSGDRPDGRQSKKPAAVIPGESDLVAVVARRESPCAAYEPLVKKNGRVSVSDPPLAAVNWSVGLRRPWVDQPCDPLDISRRVRYARRASVPVARECAKSIEHTSVCCEHTATPQNRRAGLEHTLRRWIN